MGTNNGKLKKQKRATNNSQENRRKQVLQEARAKSEEVEDRLGRNPATQKELAALERQFSRKR